MIAPRDGMERADDGSGDLEGLHRTAASDAAGPSLLDLVDHLLDQGVVIHGELVLGLADVDLVYVRVSALIAPADKILPQPRKREREP